MRGPNMIIPGRGRNGQSFLLPTVIGRTGGMVLLPGSTRKGMKVYKNVADGIKRGAIDSVDKVDRTMGMGLASQLNNLTIHTVKRGKRALVGALR